MPPANWQTCASPLLWVTAEQPDPKICFWATLDVAGLKTSSSQENLPSSEKLELLWAMRAERPPCQTYQADCPWPSILMNGAQT